MPKSHTLLQLSQSIERFIKSTFNSTYWVSAEISKLNFYPKSGHCYPELVEKANGKIVAEIRSTIWSSTYQRLAHKFKSETGEELREGMKILFFIQVKYSPTHGISLNIVDIDPSYTLGEIAKEKKQTIKKLKDQNLFEANKQVPFPYFPQRIAIVSVISSKGYQDFLETMKAKASHINYFQELFPAILQGDNAVSSITEQLELIEKRSANFDIVLIIRGGGGDVGLNCYNNFQMASKVASFPIPVITGIGHSTNETVVEMVSHTNKITPTAVADSLVEIYRRLELQLNQSFELLTNVLDSKIKPQKQQLLNYIHFLKSFSSKPISGERILLNKVQNRIWGASKELIQFERNKIDSEIKDKLTYKCKEQLQKSFNDIDVFTTKLKMLDPKNVLKRGFSITSVNGKIVTDTRNLKIGQVLTTQLQNGIIASEIKEINNE
ncbi:MAG: exodeoxyribonuclease VII large subunit [Salibacteraceae bacterium]